MKVQSFALAAILGAVVGCSAPTGAPSGGSSGTGQEATPSKTLTAILRAEPPSLAGKPLSRLGLSAGLASRMFNAGLVIRDDHGVPMPYLAQEVPQLNTANWRLSPDGTMETVYRLKPNAGWQDGEPLTADDFVFAYEIYSAPAFGLASSTPMNIMDGVTALDPQTVRVHWKRTYPDAAALDGGITGMSSPAAFPPLPRHLIGQAFASQDVEAFVANPFWTTQYIGAGPYKLDQWETGAFVEGIAFDGHILGKPQIPRIRLLFISDPNAAIANLLSGTANLTTGDILRFQEMQTLQQQWPDGKYVVFFSTYRITQFQRKPAYASTAAFLDARVRQALAHGVDWDSLNEALFEGQGLRSTGPIQPSTAYYGDLDKVVAHYPFDSRRTEQLMTDAGLTRGLDGVWASRDPAIGRMSFETNVLASPASDNEMHIMADTWRKLGFEVKEVDWSPAQGQDNEVRNTFPGLSTTSTPSGEQAMSEYRSDRIPTPQNRWTGNDRGAWPGSPDYDGLADVWETSLDRNDRIRSVIEMNKVMNDQVVVINLYWNLFGQAYANGVVGPRSTDPSTTAEWNIHEWEFR